MNKYARGWAAAYRAAGNFLTVGFVSAALGLAAFGIESFVASSDAQAGPFRCTAVARLNHGAGRPINKSHRAVVRDNPRAACNVALQQCRNFVDLRIRQGYQVYNARCGVTQQVDLHHW